MIILNESKIKYDKLNEILEQSLLDISFKPEINIIVDLKEVIKKFFRPDFFPNIVNVSEIIEEISSDIINIISHYRNYFYKKGKHSNFYFLYSFSECEEIKKAFPNYKKDFYDKYFRNKEDIKKIDIIKSSMKIVEKVVNKVPYARFINTSKYDELVYAKFIIEKTKENEMNIILSNDSTFFQLLNNHTFLINLKGIKSSLITKDNAIKDLIKEDSELSSNLIPLILSIGGNKKYSINNIPSVAIKKAVNILTILKNKDIVKDVNSIEIPLEFSKLDINNKLDKILIDNKESIIFNYKLNRADEILYSHKLEIESDFKILSKGTIKNFLDLNAKVFVKFPLQLDMMLKGEK